MKVKLRGRQDYIVKQDEHYDFSCEDSEDNYKARVLLFLHMDRPNIYYEVHEPGLGGELSFSGTLVTNARGRVVNYENTGCGFVPHQVLACLDALKIHHEV